jgi:SAM-dependent methyltransferase
MEDRAALVLGDAESLAEFGEDEFDIAICMTNTLGNLTPEKQERFIRRLCGVLKPTGRVLISVYSKDSVAARIESYKAIGLNVVDRGSYIEAAEGLRSQHFTGVGLRSLLEDNGLKISNGVDEVARIGLAAVASPKQ